VTKLPPTAAVPTPRPASSSESEPGGPAEQGTSRSSAEAEEGWRSRATALRDSISNAEKTIPEIEDRIAGLRNDRNPTNLMDPNREQHRQAEIAKAQAELEAVKAGLETSRQALASLEEEARRKGIPSGWLR
jgi:chromosome segregation ATPase